MRVAKGEKVKEKEKGGEKENAELRRGCRGRRQRDGGGGGSRVVPGNFTEWRNNVSYATFPEWRAVGGRVGSLQILTAARGTKNESAMERVKIAGKREEMQSLSGMQLGARHRLGKDPSLSVFHLGSSFSHHPPFLSLSLRRSPSQPYRSRLSSAFSRQPSFDYIRTQISTPVARLPVIRVSVSRHAHGV